MNARVVRGPTLVCIDALAGVPAFVRDRYGAKVLREANRAIRLDIERLEGHDCFITHATMLAFLESIARQTGESNLGLLLAPGLEFKSYGVWARHVLGANTLGAAIQRARRTLGYHSQGDRMMLAVAGGTAHFTYLSAARGCVGYRHDALGTVAVMISLCQHYLASGWRPLRIELDIPRPEDARSHEDLFQCPVRFDMPAIALVMDAAALLRRRPREDRAVLVTVGDVARARLAPVTRAHPLGVIVACIRTQVLAGQVSIDATAHALDTSTRSLQRGLSSMGIRFRDIVNRTRCEHAAELLRDRTLRVHEIAEEMGYSSSTHLCRAFRKAAGMPPMEYRASLAGSEGR